MPTSEATKNRVDALTAVAGLAAAGVLALAVYEYDQLRRVVERLGDDVSELRLMSEANALERKAHDTRADYWIAVIDKTRDQVQELRENARARPDPFTGEDGRKLQTLVDAMKQEVAGLRSCCGRAALPPGAHSEY